LLRVYKSTYLSAESEGFDWELRFIDDLSKVCLYIEGDNYNFLCQLATTSIREYESRLDWSGGPASVQGVYPQHVAYCNHHVCYQWHVREASMRELH
jgi:hypothetical protein